MVVMIVTGSGICFSLVCVGFSLARESACASYRELCRIVRHLKSSMIRGRLFQVSEMLSAFHRPAQRNAFRHRGVRQQSRLSNTEIHSRWGITSVSRGTRL